MIRIKSISIDGFKGYGSIEISPKKFNIVTGKNNVGKTSFLEAIDLAFDPGDIRRYDDNTGKIVNVHKDKAKIKCEFNHERGQKSLREFVDDEVDSRRVEISHPTEGQVIEYIERLFYDRLRAGNGFEQLLIRHIQADTDLDTDNGSLSRIITSSLEEAVDEAFDEYVDGELLEQFREHSLTVKADNSTSGYVYRGEGYDELSNVIGQLTGERINSQIVEQNLVDADVAPYEMEIVDDIRFTVENQFRRANRGQHGRGTFLNDIHTIEGIRYVDNFNISEKNINRSDEDAIILTEIEDFLINHNIVSNLRDFNLDTLVFEENGERYTIPYEFMGDGFKSVVGLLWELKRHEGDSSVILLEEPENHMHPGYIQELVDFLIEISINTDLQLFISTHNIDFISEFFNRTDDYSEYLKGNSQIIQIRNEFATVLPYDAAEENINELHLDLRGI